MDPEQKAKRAEAKLAVDTIKELIAEGIVPRSIAVGTVTIDVASYQPPRTAAVGDPPPMKFRGHQERLAERMAARVAKAGN